MNIYSKDWLWRRAESATLVQMDTYHMHDSLLWRFYFLFFFFTSPLLLKNTDTITTPVRSLEALKELEVKTKTRIVYLDSNDGDKHT